MGGKDIDEERGDIVQMTDRGYDDMATLSDLNEIGLLWDYRHTLPWQLHFYILPRWDLSMWPRLISNSWPNAILPPWPPKCWDLQRWGFTMLVGLVSNSYPQVIHLPRSSKVLGLQSFYPTLIQAKLNRWDNQDDTMSAEFGDPIKKVVLNERVITKSLSPGLKLGLVNGQQTDQKIIRKEKNEVIIFVLLASFQLDKEMVLAEFFLGRLQLLLRQFQNQFL
ncbi:hypothetical protein AAY473_012291 [Plecturocebus cupreus]